MNLLRVVCWYHSSILRMTDRQTRSQTSMMGINVEKLSNDGKILMKHIQAEFDKFSRDHLARFHTELDKFKNEFSELMKSKDVEIQQLKEEVTSFRTEVKKLKQGIDDADQYERRDSVILSGSALPPMPEGENTHNLVLELLKDKWNVVLSLQDIDTTHRLAPLKRRVVSAPARHNIYIKFVRRDIKNAVIRASKDQPRGATLFANESLTPLRSKMFHALRKMKRETPTVKGCTTRDGKMFAFTAPLPNQRLDQRHFIADWDALMEFCRTHVQKPLDAFLLENLAA